MRPKKPRYSGKGRGNSPRAELTSPPMQVMQFRSQDTVLPSFTFLFSRYWLSVNVTENLFIHLVLFFNVTFLLT